MDVCLVRPTAVDARPRLRRAVVCAAGAVAVAAPSSAHAVAVASTLLVSSAPGGAPFAEPGIDARLGGQGSVSDDGRFIVFDARGAGLLAGMGNTVAVYVKDLADGSVQLVSREPGTGGVRSRPPRTRSGSPTTAAGSRSPRRRR